MTDPFKQLLKQLEIQRRQSILEAEQKFYKALLLAGTFDRPAWKPRRKKHGIQPVKPGTPFHRWKTINAAHAVLSAGQPMTLVEIGVELVQHGHRSDDGPRKLLRSIREALRYHPDKFTQDVEGRWGLV